jgi:hypothetical protein
LTLSGTPTWSVLTTAGTRPGARADHVAFYDPVRDRMVVYRGPDLWQLLLSGTPTWAQIATVGSPPGSIGATGVYDPVRDQAIFFGGEDPCSPTYCERSETWVMPLCGNTWFHPPLNGPIPSARFFHSAAYDPDTRRMFIVGGYSNSSGAGESYSLGDCGPVDVPAAHFETDLTLLGPNPTPGPTRIELSVARRVMVDLSLFDIAGRVRRRIARGIYEPGRYTFDWDGRVANGMQAAPGVYLLRVAAGDRVLVRHLVRL